MWPLYVAYLMCLRISVKVNLKLFSRQRLVWIDCLVNAGVQGNKKVDLVAVTAVEVRTQDGRGRQSDVIYEQLQVAGTKTGGTTYLRML